MSFGVSMTTFEDTETPIGFGSVASAVAFSQEFGVLPSLGESSFIGPVGCARWVVVRDMVATAVEAAFASASLAVFQGHQLSFECSHSVFQVFVAACLLVVQSLVLGNANHAGTRITQGRHHVVEERVELLVTTCASMVGKLFCVRLVLQVDGGTFIPGSFARDDGLVVRKPLQSIQCIVVV